MTESMEWRKIKQYIWQLCYPYYLGYILVNTKPNWMAFMTQHFATLV